MAKKKKKVAAELRRWLLAALAVALSVLMVWLLVLPTDHPYYAVANTIMEIVAYVFLIGLILVVAGFAIYYIFFYTSTSAAHALATVDDILETFKNRLLLLVTLVGIGAVWYLSIDPRWFVDDLKELFPNMNFRLPAGGDLFGYYTAQLSLTFISISVMGVLSDNGVLIYWINASEERLIKPTFTSFAAYTYYSIGATIGAGVAVFAGLAPTFFAFFVVNILVLILLTSSMIDVYFGKEKTKKKLRDRLIKDFYYFRKKQEGTPLTVYQQTRAKNYEDAIRGLRQSIYHAQAASDLTLLNDIYDLYFHTLCVFSSNPGIQVPQVILATLTDQTFPTFYTTLDKFVRDMPRLKKGTPVLFREDMFNMFYAWNMDEDLWVSLCKSPYFAQWIHRQEITAGWAPMELLFVVKRRLVQLYNDMVTEEAADQRALQLLTKEEPWNTADFLLSMDDDGKVTLESTGEEIPFDRVKTVFEASFHNLVLEHSLTSGLVQTLLRLLRREDTAEWMAARMSEGFPLLQLLASYAKDLDLDAEEKALLRKHFPPRK
ncbi:MAG: hypothetical protein IKA47_10115 [Oscillospiraceae bacterium]|nr:hypothetical protein [Oscillospiraceae bacterium]